MASEAKVIIIGVKETLAHFEAVKVKVDEAAERIVTKGAVTIASNAKREFRARPLGSLTTSKNGTKYYSSAPPYEPKKPSPTNRTGNLRDGIKMIDARRVGFGKWESTTSPTAKYGARVEKLGYLYMKPGFEKSRTELERIYEKEWAKALR